MIDRMMGVLRDIFGGVRVYPCLIGSMVGE